MTTYILSIDGRQIASTTSERAAKSAARQALGADRIGEYQTEDGWCYYQAGDDDDNSPVVRVRIG